MLEIQGHRGNSEFALRSLLAGAPTSVEIDVGVTADGAVVVSHEVRATTVECRPSLLLGKPWPELSAADARALGRLTLDQALAFAGSTLVTVEAKSFPPHTAAPREFARALQPYLPRITLSSFDKRVLSHARRLHRPLETTFLLEVPVRVATAAR